MAFDAALKSAEHYADDATIRSVKEKVRKLSAKQHADINIFFPEFDAANHALYDGEITAQTAQNLSSAVDFFLQMRTIGIKDYVGLVKKWDLDNAHLEDATELLSALEQFKEQKTTPAIDLVRASTPQQTVTPKTPYKKAADLTQKINDNFAVIAEHIETLNLNADTTTNAELYRLRKTTKAIRAEIEGVIDRLQNNDQKAQFKEKLDKFSRDFQTAARATHVQEIAILKGKITKLNNGTMNVPAEYETAEQAISAYQNEIENLSAKNAKEDAPKQDPKVVPFPVKTQSEKSIIPAWARRIATVASLGLAGLFSSASETNTQTAEVVTPEHSHAALELRN